VKRTQLYRENVDFSNEVIFGIYANSWSGLLAKLARRGKAMKTTPTKRQANFSSKVGQAVKWALKAGVRLIDTAFMYGNEKEIGDALKEVLAEG